jgi:hypothetical protein
MFKILIILVICFFVFSSSKEKDKEDQYLTFIKAGQTDGSGISSINFEPAKELENWENDYTMKILNLDLNNDSIMDFELNYHSRASGSCCYFKNSYITPLGNNSVCVTKSIPEGSFNTFVQSLALGDTIGISNNWSNSKAYLFSFWSSTHPDPTNNGQQFTQISIYGDWYKQDNIYLGVKIVKGDRDFFGWINVKMGGQAVRGYAVTFPF